MVHDGAARVPCPLDPKHSVWEKDLGAHIRRCNARPADKPPACFRQNANTRLDGAAEPTCSDEPLTYESLFAALDAFAAAPGPPEQILSHTGLHPWLDAKENHKHIVQQSSLVGHLQQANLLSPDTFYVEFGCGKAELSRAINTCMASDYGDENGNETADSGTPGPLYGYGLIDRGVNRMKMDHKIKTETPLRPHVTRCRIDIEHLDLDAFMPEHVTSWVGVSKHLCGVATDLTLKSILNSHAAGPKMGGLVVAMCCRHVCDYMQLLPESRDFLARHGVHSGGFGLLKRVVSWAVCGRREGDGGAHESGLGFAERERYGFLARRLIDASRVHAVQALMPAYSAQLVLYAKTDTTLENHCLVVQRK